MIEIWALVHGYENKYKVSTLGRVVHLRFNRELGGWLDRDGYRKFGLYSDAGKLRLHLSHRIVMATFIGPSLLQVNHKNLVKDDNRLETLEYVTLHENVLRARAALGSWGLKNEFHPNTKVSFAEMVEILFMLIYKVPQKNISIGYGIREDYIKGLKRRTDYELALDRAHKLIISPLQKL